MTKIEKILSTYSFVFLDTTIKIFALVFTLLTKYYLDKTSFSEISYFRTTLTMIVGLISSALGFYILNFYSSQKKSAKEFSRFWGLIFFVPSIGFGIYLLLSIFYPNLLGISVIKNINSSFLFIIVIFSSLSQISIFFLRVISGTKIYIKFFLLITSVTLFVLFISLHAGINTASYYILLIYYFFFFLLCLYIIVKSDDFIYIKKSILNISFKIDSNFKEFYLPNFLESMLSVPITWLSLTIYIAFIGISDVGDILLVQMILGLFVFVCNSFVLNYFTSIKTDNINSRTISLNVLSRLMIILSLILILVTSVFWNQIKYILRIENMENISIWLLCAGTILKINLMSVGAIFKRYNLSKLTLSHNIIFGLAFLISELLFIRLNINNSYSLAFLISWLSVAIVIIFHSVKYNVAKIKLISFLVAMIMVFYLSLFYIFIGV